MNNKFLQYLITLVLFFAPIKSLASTATLSRSIAEAVPLIGRHRVDDTRLIVEQELPSATSPSTMTTSALTGMWKLDEKRSTSFAPFLQASGAPGFVARSLAKALDKDILDFSLTESTVNVFYRRGRTILPFKIQTDVTYNKGETTTIETPVGVQYGTVVESRPDFVQIQRHDPKRGEKSVDVFVASADELVYHLTHQASDGTETKVRRVFRSMQ